MPRRARVVVALEGEVHLLDAVALGGRAELGLGAVRGAAEEDAVLGLHGGSPSGWTGAAARVRNLTETRDVHELHDARRGIRVLPRADPAQAHRAAAVAAVSIQFGTPGSAWRHHEPHRPVGPRARTCA